MSIRTKESIDGAMNIYSEIEAFFGDTKAPNYSRAIGKLRRGFPEPLYGKLTELYWIKDVTDFDSDVAFFLSLLSESNKYLIIYSVVVDGFHIIEFNKTKEFDGCVDYENARSLNPEDEFVLLCKKFAPGGSSYLDTELLMKEVEFNWDDEGLSPVPLYKVLFLIEGELPYFR